MKAIQISAPGGPSEVLQLVERPKPAPGPADVLIKVAAAGVNRPDVLQRKGLYPPPPGASDLPGLEASGVVEAVGSAVDRWKVGDAVCALLTGGGYAEYALADQGSCLPVPNGVSIVEVSLRLPTKHLQGYPSTLRFARGEYRRVIRLFHEMSTGR